MLVIEDGTGVVGSNSYASVEELQEYATARGLTLPSEVPRLEALLIDAEAYLSSLMLPFQGWPVSAGQLLSWPRTNGEDDWAYSQIVPQRVKQAQLFLAAAGATAPLFKIHDPTDRGPIKAVTVGPIKTEYAGSSNTTSSGGGAYQHEVLMLLVPYLRPRGASVRAYKAI